MGTPLFQKSVEAIERQFINPRDQVVVALNFLDAAVLCVDTVPKFELYTGLLDDNVGLRKAYC
jgi:hypothetical protein